VATELAAQSDLTRRTYDRVAAEFARRSAERPPAVVAAVRRLRAGLPAGAVVLDAGCGPGHDAQLLRHSGLRVLALDLSSGMLRQVDSGLPAVQADVTALPLADGSVDAVWCNAALLHVPRELAPAALRGLRRVLRTGGPMRLVTAEGDGEGWEDGTYDVPDPRWFVYHREPELRRMLVAGGFEVLEASREVTHRTWLQLTCRAC
jgi:ubiquinone/menaquinone biosynthesis C-methylase UbiE